MDLLPYDIKHLIVNDYVTNVFDKINVCQALSLDLSTFVRQELIVVENVVYAHDNHGGGEHTIIAKLLPPDTLDYMTRYCISSSVEILYFASVIKPFRSTKHKSLKEVRKKFLVDLKVYEERKRFARKYNSRASEHKSNCFIQLEPMNNKTDVCDIFLRFATFNYTCKKTTTQPVSLSYNIFHYKGRCPYVVK
ncbi:orf25 [Sucra jujuba nucleopolyhedrovirus]|uniref:Orf25 n=1 Tax=Sucra jujuba nucleopolyhedrovirus TaxID=1563660 RepID=A0A097P8Y9_9ABAC|nr:orf25 [Sucra jujuba nucleopolyhedrovirus]AIU41264.1 orf25 [Sucra jujuba nucleopolyhedrovirus]